jgi:hypothetical protein
MEQEQQGVTQSVQGHSGPAASANGDGAGMTAEQIREKVKNADDIIFEDVPVPEWGVTIRVFSMSGADRGKVIRRTTDKRTGEVDQDKAYPVVLAGTCFAPETGEKPNPEHQIFDAERDAAWLNEKNSGLLERVAKVAFRLSGMDRDAEEKAGKGS